MKKFVFITVVLIPGLLFSMGIKPSKKMNETNVNVSDAPSAFESVVCEPSCSYGCLTCPGTCQSSGCEKKKGSNGKPYCTEIKCTGENCSGSSSCTMEKRSNVVVADNKIETVVTERRKTTYEKDKDGNITKKSLLAIPSIADAPGHEYECIVRCSAVNGGTCTASGCDVDDNGNCPQTGICTGGTCANSAPACIRYVDGEEANTTPSAM